MTADNWQAGLRGGGDNREEGDLGELESAATTQLSSQWSSVAKLFPKL